MCHVISLSGYIYEIQFWFHLIVCFVYIIRTCMYSNTDKERSSCLAPEEQWSDDVGDSQEYVESPFIPGSLVWAKLDKYPWYTDTP